MNSKAKPVLKIKLSPRQGKIQEQPKLQKPLATKPTLKIKKSPRGETSKPVVKPKMPFPSGNISQIPRELYPTLFKDLPVQDILNLCKTSKEQRTICDNDDLWKFLVQRDYPNLYLTHKDDKITNRYWFGLYSNFLARRAGMWRFGNIQEAQAKRSQLERGDLVVLRDSPNTYIYDGEFLNVLDKKSTGENLEIITGNVMEYFQVVTEFPPLFWERREKTLLWFDANPFMDQLIKNLDVRTVGASSYVVTHFTHGGIDYQVIYDNHSRMKEGKIDERLLPYYRNLYASRMYESSVYVNLYYPKDRTLFVSNVPKYSEEEYIRNFSYAKGAGDFKEYARIADNVDVYDLRDGYLRRLFINQENRKELEFWINYKRYPLDLELISYLNEDNDDLFYIALERLDFKYYEIGGDLYGDIQSMLESWESKNKPEYLSRRIRTVLTDPMFPKEMFREVEDLLKEYKFKLEKKEESKIEKFINRANKKLDSLLESHGLNKNNIFIQKKVPRGSKKKALPEKYKDDIRELISYMTTLDYDINVNKGSKLPDVAAELVEEADEDHPRVKEYYVLLKEALRKSLL